MTLITNHPLNRLCAVGAASDADIDNEDLASEYLVLEMRYFGCAGAPVRFVCPNGHEERVVLFYFETGGWFAVDEADLFCTVCCAEMEETDE